MSQLQGQNDRTMLGREGLRQLMRRVRQALSKKQDKLTGAPGQVVGFDAEGAAAARDGWSNPDLLLNWDFRWLINRNGQEEYTAAGLTIDGWRKVGANGSVKVEADGILLDNTDGSADMYWGQVLPASLNLGGKSVSLSVKCSDGNLYSGAGTVQAIEGEWQVRTDLSSGEMYIQLSDTYAMFVRVPAGRTIKLTAVKLELGGRQTLARQNAAGEWEIIDPPDYDLQYLLCSQYSPNTGEWVGLQHSNPNLLDNWYFADPINQRGLVAYKVTSGNSMYTIDRWILGYGLEILDITPGGIVLSNLSGIYNLLAQRFEPHSLQWIKGKQVTISVLAKGDGEVRIGAVNHTKKTFTVHGDRYTPYSYTFTWTTADDEWMNSAFLSVTSGQVTLFAAKLELGPTQTLAHKEGDTWVLNDPPPNKALELLKCQRYFYKFNGDFLTHSTSKFAVSPYCYGTAWLPTPMRVHPAVSNITYAQDGAVPEATNWRWSTDSILFQSYGGEAQILGFDASADL